MDDSLGRLFRPGERRRVAVRVTKDALRQIRSGHPWVFESSITSTAGEAQSGDLAVIFDGDRRSRGSACTTPAHRSG